MLLTQAAQDPGPRWRYCILLLLAVRQWVFLGLLCAAVPTLVLWRGADALSICLNAVALLFLAEIDDALFHFGLPSRLRGKMEAVARRLELSESQRSALDRSSYAHLLLVVVVVLGTVQFGGSLPAGFWTGVVAFPPRFIFLAGGLWDTVTAAAAAATTGSGGAAAQGRFAPALAKICGKFAVGLLVAFCLTL